jgi:mono/diheme cytochrome c family protein
LNDKRALACAASLVGSILLSACGGGGGDVAINPAAPPEPPVPGLSDPNSFLLFPNPQLQSNGSVQTNTVAYAQAYYRAIDPTNAKDTLAKWKFENGFDTGGNQVTVVFGDKRDLAWGRRMTARQNDDGTVAVMAENYLVEPAAGYLYSSVSNDAAVNEDRRWHLSTSAIEFSPGPTGGLAFTKFFSFDASGARELTVDMDGGGEKALPAVCMTCHGGRADALTPPDATGNPRFPLIAHSPTGERGDVLGSMPLLEVDQLDFSSSPGFTRAEQEAAIKIVNRMILCTYPIPGAAPKFPEDACRRDAQPNEWQGPAAQLIKNAYGGDGLPSATFSKPLVPAGWSTVGQTSLYRDVVANYCRACHILRGTASQSDIDFDSFAKFQGFADRTKAHVMDRGNMPLARIVYDAFIADPSAVGQLATFLEGQGFTVRDGGGTVLRAGRPIADPGPDRVVRQGATNLSATNSLFASSYQWSIVSGPAGATLTNTTSAQPTFTTIADGTYLLQLIVTGNGVASTPAQLQIVVNNALAPAPSAIRFSHLKTVLQTPGCAGCHRLGGFGSPPIVFTDIDRNGDGISGDATDDLWFYTEVRGLINFTDIVASPLLSKASGGHHRGGRGAGFDTSVAPGQAARANYDLFVNWILNGAPL